MRTEVFKWVILLFIATVINFLIAYRDIYHNGVLFLFYFIFLLVILHSKKILTLPLLIILLYVFIRIPIMIIHPIYDKQVAETKRNGEVIVSALEKYYQNYKCYPASLSELIPKYIEKIPDSSMPISNNAFQYKIEKMADGRFIYMLKFNVSANGGLFYFRYAYDKNWRYDDG